MSRRCDGVAADHAPCTHGPEDSPLLSLPLGFSLSWQPVRCLRTNLGCLRRGQSVVHLAVQPHFRKISLAEIWILQRGTALCGRELVVIASSAKAIWHAIVSRCKYERKARLIL